MSRVLCMATMGRLCSSFMRLIKPGLMCTASGCIIVSTHVPGFQARLICTQKHQEPSGVMQKWREMHHKAYGGTSASCALRAQREQNKPCRACGLRAGREGLLLLKTPSCLTLCPWPTHFHTHDTAQHSSSNTSQSAPLLTGSSTNTSQSAPLPTCSSASRCCTSPGVTTQHSSSNTSQFYAPSPAAPQAAAAPPRASAPPASPPAALWPGPRRRRSQPRLACPASPLR